MLSTNRVVWDMIGCTTAFSVTDSPLVITAFEDFAEVPGSGFAHTKLYWMRELVILPQKHSCIGSPSLRVAAITHLCRSGPGRRPLVRRRAKSPARNKSAHRRATLLVHDISESPDYIGSSILGKLLLFNIIQMVPALHFQVLKRRQP
jgi:hypothetical protein